MPPLLSSDGRRIAEISVLRALQNQRQRNPDFASSGLEAIGAIPSFLDGTHSRLAARPVWPSPNPCTAGLQTNGLPGLWSCEIVSEAIRSRSWTRRGAALPTGRQAQGFSEDHTGPSACHGQVGWMPRGEEGRPYNHIYISRKPLPCGRKASFSHP